MRLQSEKPKFPYATLEDYCRSFYRLTNNGPLRWPCLECRGYGWIYDPSEQPCPVEGYKMVTRLTCQACKGTKEGPKKPIVAAYSAMKREYAAMSREWLRLRTLWSRLRLTDEEIAAIKVFGLPQKKKRSLQ